MRISIIVAMGKNREIGHNGKLPWDLPDDRALFRTKTENHYIIMGRGTFESIGHPLPKRTNIVLSSSLPKQDGILVASNLEQALRLIPEKEIEVFIAGGEPVYKAALPLADRLYLTKIDAEFPHATKFFPKYDENNWELKVAVLHNQDSRHIYAYETCIFDRKER